jgi:hypothetical protein
MGGTLRMVGSIFDAFDGGAFKGLLGIREFFDALFIRIRDFGQALRTSGLARAAGANLRRVVAKFIGLSVVIAFKLRVSLERCVAGFLVVAHAAVLV